MNKNEATISVRIDPLLKSKAEAVLSELNMPTSRLISLLYKQIVLKRCIPFDLSLPYDEPLVYDNLTDEQLYKELKKGHDDIKAGRVVSAKKVNKMIKKEFGL